MEDYEYWLRILFKYKNIGYIDEVLYRYRNQSRSLTATRINEILYYNSKMRIKYINEIVGGLKSNPDLLCSLFYEICNYYEYSREVYNKVVRYVPEISMDCENEYALEFIVYGAGKIGNEVYEKYGNRIKYYADRDVKKEGTYLNGIQIVSLERLKELSKQYQVVIAAGNDKIYDFLQTIKALGIKTCIVYKRGLNG